MYTQCMHVSISMRVWLHGRTDRRCGPAAHARTCCVRARARACAIGRPRNRADTCERVPSASTAVARLAGVQLGVGVQRQHRRVEHRVGHHVVLGMRRHFGPGGAPPRVGRARPGRRCGAGRCARRRHRCARVCVCADVWARACAGVHVCRYSCAYERRVICMYVCIRI
jgi:hypothetical protein